MSKVHKRCVFIIEYVYGFVSWISRFYIYNIYVCVIRYNIMIVTYIGLKFTILINIRLSERLELLCFCHKKNEFFPWTLVSRTNCRTGDDEGRSLTYVGQNPAILMILGSLLLHVYDERASGISRKKTKPYLIFE